jgi:nucleotide-binding universal stress UspA family protein
MSILCGTDFSEPSARALTAAAHLAVRMQVPLHVMHAIESTAAPDELDAEMRTTLERKLTVKTERLRELGARVQVHVKVGPPDESLLALARELDTQLIVVGALGRREPGRWQLGSHADRLAQRTHVPVLVVRNTDPFDAWARPQRPLRVLIGADLSRSTEAVADFLHTLRRAGPCDVTAVHLYWAPEQFQRLGLGGVRSFVDPDPEVTRTLVRELEARLASAEDGSTLKVRAEPHLGRVGDRLAVLATREEADLVLVGTHDRDLVGRLWEPSVSRGVLHCAETSVVCVPLPHVDPQDSEIKPLRSVLVATDFSRIGNTAIPLAYSLLAPGGTMHLVHVTTPSPRGRPLDPRDIFPANPSVQRGELVEQLRRLIPTNAREFDTQVHVLESDEPALAICQGAERLGVDALCLGTRGRSGLTRAMLGSVAQTVLAQSQRPVMLAHQPRD